MARALGRPLAQWMSGAAIVLLGFFIIWEGANYSLGTGFTLGPGAFPVAVGAALVILGALTVLERPTGAAAVRPRLSPTLFVGAGILAWSYLVERYGLYPATVALVLLSGLGPRELRPATALALAVLLAVAGHLVFIVGLGLPLDPIRW